MVLRYVRHACRRWCLALAFGVPVLMAGGISRPCFGMAGEEAAVLQAAALYAPADLNRDDSVDQKDLAWFISAWRAAKSGTPDARADVDEDGKITYVDAGYVIGAVGVGVPPANATVSIDRAVFTGLTDKATITVVDPDLPEWPVVRVRVSSQRGEPGGEIVRLHRVDRGRFSGTVEWERLFTSTEKLSGLAGDGKVAVYAEGPYASDTVTVEFKDGRRPDGKLTTVRATCHYQEPASTLTGVVKDTSGKPIVGALIQLTGPGGFSAQAVSRSGAGYEGHYSFYGLASGQYQLTVSVAGHVQQTVYVTVRAEPSLPPAAQLSFNKAVYQGPEDTATITLTDNDLAGSTSATVRVKSDVSDPTGETVTLQAVAGSPGTFRGTVKWERFLGADGKPAISLGNGRVGVYAEGDVDSEVIICEYRDVAHPPGYADTVVAYARYQEPWTTLTGVLRTPDGVPILGAALRLTRSGGFSRDAVSRSGGRYAGHYSFYDLSEGTYLLTIAADGYERQTVIVEVKRP